MKIITGRIAKPRRILLYGIHGCGKSTWAASAPGVLFADVEGGLNDIDCAKTAKMENYGDLLSTVSWLATEPHNYQCFAIDTLDWAEKLIHSEVCRDKGVNAIEDIGYGKGYESADKKWMNLLKGLDFIRDQRGIGTILLAHSKITKFADPETDSYDRYEPDLHKSASGLVQEWCDEVFFASYRVFTRSEDLGFNKTRSIAIGGKERFIRTTESASARAKNRLRLPDELPMDWNSYAQYLPGNTVAPVGNVPGLVVNGSSKVEG